MRYCQHKELNSLLASLVRQGWRFQRGGKHNKLWSPNGRLLVVPKTPSDWRAIRNLASQSRRLSAAAQRQE